MLGFDLVQDNISYYTVSQIAVRQCHKAAVIRIPIDHFAMLTCLPSKVPAALLLAFVPSLVAAALAGKNYDNSRPRYLVENCKKDEKISKEVRPHPSSLRLQWFLVTRKLNPRIPFRLDSVDHRPRQGRVRQCFRDTWSLRCGRCRRQRSRRGCCYAQLPDAGLSRHPGRLQLRYVDTALPPTPFQIYRTILNRPICSIAYIVLQRNRNLAGVRSLSWMAGCGLIISLFVSAGKLANKA